jgi:hypothetical protein
MAELTGLMCPNCGAELPRRGLTEQATCPLCGAQLATELRAIPIAPATAPPACPLCGETDSIEKISSMYASEISRGYYSLPWRQSRLSKSLKPPQNPPSADPRGIAMLNLGAFLFGLSVWSGVYFFAGEPVRVPPSEVIVLGMAIDTTGGVTSAALILMVALLVAIPMIVGAALAFVGYKRIRSWQERLPHERGRYERATRRWESLYYCPRDHGVFLPGDTLLVPTARIRELLYG